MSHEEVMIKLAAMSLAAMKENPEYQEQIFEEFTTHAIKIAQRLDEALRFGDSLTALIMKKPIIKL